MLIWRVNYLENQDFQKKIINATKWSFVTEIMAKLINPITNMVLARLLSPDAFGVVATITMITSFADMIADAGFQKYIIQYEFKDELDRKNTTDVAFWTNLGISIILWIVIIIFSEQLAIMVGNTGLGYVISIACMQVPITAFSSIQMASCKRDFDYRQLFSVRIVTIIIPFIVTIPLAIIGFGYWALIIGTIVGGTANAYILTKKCKYKPSIYYNIGILKQMVSFSIWSLVEAISIWLTAWIDAFIIGSILDSYYLGLYKTSINVVNSIMSIITVSTTSIIFSSLCRLQNNKLEFQTMFFTFQKLLSLLIIPMGIGIYMYSDTITKILLGNQWNQASDIIGIWGLTSSIKMILGDYCSEVFRAKGKPKLSFFAQLLHLIVLVPTCLISVKYGFWTLVYARSWIRMQLVIIQWILMIVVIKIPILKSFKNISTSVLCTFIMVIFGYFTKTHLNSFVGDLISIVVCIVVYVAVVYVVDSEIRSRIKKVLKSKLTNKHMIST